ncbi:hypothetical protein [Hymenobacter yonginensis]|uniref:DUF5723 domain-containing protein n=1 Tax=Hymenobacter yonginensis TaxID=748197 RepID=A0ABY7PMS4_9BACT|nr:hypothetical protein [Hymenobacter yonginensis]WBO83830.1 hypothetical protein O9Z63_15790 [Hymenobacter yonginensis]
MYRLSLLRFLLPACLLAGHAYAQQPVTQPLSFSPAIGPVLDQQEKRDYGLLPEYSIKDFQEARLLQIMTPDSALTLQVQLQDGRTVLRPYTPAELAGARSLIAARQRELAATNLQPGTAASPDSVGRRYRVTLRSGSAFDGELTDRQPQRLQFLTKDLGVVQVERANIERLEELTSEVARRPANWHNIGNGNRLFFAPTARNLRQGEGSLQDISLYFVGANYGFTDNFSMGVMFSAIPTVPLQDQFLALTPKFSAKISEKWHAGAGLLYLRIPDFEYGNNSFGVGLAYGLATYGSADDNFTVGLGYGFSGSGILSTPVLQVGGQKRISRRVSLISENYLIANSKTGMGGLYGAKINWRRTSLGLGAFYALAYNNNDDNYNDYGPRVFSSYIVPVYYDFTFRFGKGSK